MVKMVILKTFSVENVQANNKIVLTHSFPHTTHYIPLHTTTQIRKLWITPKISFEKRLGRCRLKLN